MTCAYMPNGITVVWDNTGKEIGIYGTINDMMLAQHIKEGPYNPESGDVMFIPSVGGIEIFRNATACRRYIERRFQNA